MNSIYNKIYNEIKKSKRILLVRHIGPDPDAIASQISLKKSILLTFKDKEVYALGMGISKFNYIGKMDKFADYDYENDLVIATDIPNVDRIDGLDVTKFKRVIKIDHHPVIDKYYMLDITDTSASSASQLVYDLIKNTKLLMNTDIANDIFVGIISDTHRFLFDYTSIHTYEIVIELIKKYRIDTQKLYAKLYERPLSEVRLMGYISSNLKVTENKFAYIIIEDEVLKSFGADAAAPSNMINDYNSINEVLVWLFITHDPKNKDLLRLNIRSRGPIINEIAERYNGGGHKLASGIRLQDASKLDEILNSYDQLCKEYNENVNR